MAVILFLRQPSCFFYKIQRWRFCLIGIILVLLSCHFLQLAFAQITHPLEGWFLYDFF
ncbi:hypothetical protein Pint_35121 [Pistacia integerrima]|uniref:Uncharacterized protein n=1 Tax=Pistacia integerrima TaxID=434235 RepID=A0ACC0Y484_9ROSI|nr:hypothetical protein Pint_35121 [Pistacia integerrima]